ncbi:hypothetical protein [Butyrivibrio proteoclasticus]|uniref:hypothetical protein n=1 Tax=Butyrivibrio proteoclasticus TaxID=43305 RepID=UPI00047E7733|nr:hypothetical protein [Butyrivibrio proteoclasticus]
MFNIRLKRFIGTLLVTTVMLFSLVGCGKKNSSQLASYKESMAAFYDKLSYYDEAINAIDPNSDGAKAELLGYLDEMNAEYKAMAELTIPSEFAGISDIAVEAADYMSMADEYYHYAYDNEFDESSEQLASQYYQRANSRVLIMLQVLHGEDPTGEGVTVTPEEAQQFSTIGGDTSTEE